MQRETLDFIHRFEPATASGERTTLLLLHGTGGDENDLLGLGRLLAPTAALLSPRGKVSENGMPRYFRRLAEGVFDLEDLKFRANELSDFVISASRSYDFDPGKVIAVGFSNGANIAAGMLLLRPGVLSGAILFHPMVPLVPEPLPDLKGAPVFIGAGRSDPLVAPQETQRLAELLRSAGADVSLYWQDGGHQIGREELIAARSWLSERI